MDCACCCSWDKPYCVRKSDLESSKEWWQNKVSIGTRRERRKRAANKPSRFSLSIFVVPIAALSSCLSAVYIAVCHLFILLCASCLSSCMLAVYTLTVCQLFIWLCFSLVSNCVLAVYPKILSKLLSECWTRVNI